MSLYLAIKPELQGMVVAMAIIVNLLLIGLLVFLIIRERTRYRKIRKNIYLKSKSSLKMMLMKSMRKITPMPLNFMTFKVEENINLQGKKLNIIHEMMMERIAKAIPRELVFVNLEKNVFCAVIRDQVLYKDMQKYIDNCLETLMQAYVLGNDEYYMDTNIAVVSTPNAGEDMTTILKNINYAVMLSVRKGFNKGLIFDPETGSSLDEKYTHYLENITVAENTAKEMVGRYITQSNGDKFAFWTMMKDELNAELQEKIKNDGDYNWFCEKMLRSAGMMSKALVNEEKIAYALSVPLSDMANVNVAKAVDRTFKTLPVTDEKAIVILEGDTMPTALDVLQKNLSLFRANDFVIGYAPQNTIPQNALAILSPNFVCGNRTNLSEIKYAGADLLKACESNNIDIACYQGDTVAEAKYLIENDIKVLTNFDQSKQKKK